MYTESFPRGLGKFVPVEQAELAAELPDKRFPLILNTGRILYHWHGATITRRVQGLMARAPEVQVAVNPADMAAFDFANAAATVDPAEQDRHAAALRAALRAGGHRASVPR